MERGLIYFPNTLSDEEMNSVIVLIDEEIKKKSAVYGDPILVDELVKGYTNIKIFKREFIDELRNKFNISEYDIIMEFMRAQNR